ncbi:ABC transporter ATP-binding protein [Demequina sediminicola]|uniref:ABC transporter ATP-binding protein n=1 Tax=Demequina sediminicola TaxID=1095026 RepID=UPI00078326F1|nr:ATP-binding cassette domain-containing protein [Demequina sediminicola]
MRLTARDVSFTYPRGDHQVLSGVTFDIPDGASAAIIGPSGSGKTTLLSLMGHLLPLQSGTIQAVDADGTDHTLADTASWVLQTVSLLPDRTAADNVMVGAYSDGANRADARARARDYLAQVGLAGREDEPARILSGGEAQRVAIARAMASHRPIILADEPTGQLDTTTSATVLEAMIGAHGQRTVVIVTHDPAVAQRCDLVLELRDGRIVDHAGARV